MVYADYASDEWLIRLSKAEKRQKRHDSDRDGFLYALSKYKLSIATLVLTSLCAAKLTYSAMNYFFKDEPASKAEVSKEPINVPEAGLEQIAQENNVVIPAANAQATRANADAVFAPVPKPEAETHGISTDILAGYIKQTYDGWNRKHNKKMEKDTAKAYAGWIYKYADKYRIEPLFLAALLSHESRFTNAKGNLNSPNYSEGLGQIRKKTQRYIRKLMRQSGENIPEKGKNLNEDPKTAIWMTAFYLRYLMDKDGCTFWHASGHYNGGSFMNSAYANGVMGEYKGIKGYFSAHQPAPAGSKIISMR